ncbi:uncharacterized protein LOC120272512 [Dioscorea cayenensis subsp. rotundata]|uniref:Uncharacterized protein LOC120272512 n=1 Tax=Dioscorea cayennensis subsp. rotundata TaxID=55577 RepID=A0AB40CA27_DIOCR|nr:uncharacterized protein LOC120272512 [Dioscorea cayenensis subsp. rotundata]
MASFNCGRSHSNLQCFLSRTTPSVLSYSLPKSCFKDVNELWPPIGKDDIEYFTLSDFWDNYTEWSAYGAGCPILLNNGETVVQYYVPYLSAIQIYSNKPFAASRNTGEDSETDSWSDDSESEKLSRSWDAVSDDSCVDMEGGWPGKDRLGHLYLHYIENASPYGRVPLMVKVNELARHFPGLKSLKSVELSPASWMSVAWYPIYHIPTRRNVKDLSACFLTYHTISSSFQDNTTDGMENDLCCNIAGKTGKKANEVSLRPFGLAAYKMQGTLWMNPETDDQEKFINLFDAADSWLKQLRVQHHDFNYFNTHSM